MVDRYNNGRGGARGCSFGGQQRSVGRREQGVADVCGGQADRPALMADLQKLDFSIIETALYLDAYPKCRAAMNYYQKLVARRNEIISTLKSKYGVGITCFENSDSDKWLWTESPWPWESGAN